MSRGSWISPRPGWCSASGVRSAIRGRRPCCASCSAASVFAGKASTPYDGRPDSLRDYMHAKVVVVDDTVFTGSFNLSRSGEENAENVLEIDDAPTAERLAAYVDALRGRYPVINGTLA